MPMYRWAKETTNCSRQQWTIWAADGQCWEKISNIVFEIAISNIKFYYLCMTLIWDKLGLLSDFRDFMSYKWKFSVRNRSVLALSSTQSFYSFTFIPLPTLLLRSVKISLLNEHEWMTHPAYTEARHLATRESHQCGSLHVLRNRSW